MPGREMNLPRAPTRFIVQVNGLTSGNDWFHRTIAYFSQANISPMIRDSWRALPTQVSMQLSMSFAPSMAGHGRRDGDKYGRIGVHKRAESHLLSVQPNTEFELYTV